MVVVELGAFGGISLVAAEDLDTGALVRLLAVIIRLLQLLLHDQVLLAGGRGVVRLVGHRVVLLERGLLRILGGCCSAL